jgi:hypothetical protein
MVESAKMRDWTFFKKMLGGTRVGRLLQRRYGLMVNGGSLLLKRILTILLNMLPSLVGAYGKLHRRLPSIRGRDGSIGNATPTPQSSAGGNGLPLYLVLTSEGGQTLTRIELQLTITHPPGVTSLREA